MNYIIVYYSGQGVFKLNEENKPRDEKSISTTKHRGKNYSNIYPFGYL
jgi:hypothetical protein